MRRNKRSIPEIRKLIQKAIDRDVNFSSELMGEKNPQLIESRNRAIGRVEAFQDVLDALNGNDINLKIAARGLSNAM